MTRVGVLALQGDFDAHKQVLQALGCEVVCVRKPQQLEGLAALVLPGGESSALLRLMAPWDFLSAIQAFHAKGGALMGTCAGLILLARTVSPAQASLGLLDVEVMRNAYGRQQESFEARLQVDASGADGVCDAVFIRAPQILSCASGVRVLATYRNAPVWVRQGRVMAMSFHPELTSDSVAHRYFMQHVVSEVV